MDLLRIRSMGEDRHFASGYMEHYLPPAPRNYYMRKIYLTSNCSRYITKEDVATASVNKVKNDGGHVRLITKGSLTQDPSTK